MAINSNNEVSKNKVIKDTRSLGTKLHLFIFNPLKFKIIAIFFIGVQLIIPSLWPIWIFFNFILLVLMWDIKVKAPLRLPKDLKVNDSTEYFDAKVSSNSLFGLIKRTRIVRTLKKAAGILYLGYFRGTLDNSETGKELWISNSDARTHMFLAGTTGSGKSETLIGIYANALLWGAGACYGDGKADSNLGFCLWSLARRFGREDDFLVLNYLTGGTDPFENIVKKEKGIYDSVSHQSNSTNPFSDGSADFLIQLVSSLMTKSTGDGAQWQEKAITMISAIIRILAYLRAKGEGNISASILRDSLDLKSLAQIYKRGLNGEFPEDAFAPIRNYFNSGIPFNLELIDEPAKWDQEVLNQHGYLTAQFTALNMLVDTYGFIFSDRYGEVDMLDVLLNNRLLVVMIPSLEKSPTESAALGKLFISSIRLMMAQNLGYELEGYKSDVLDVKATNSPTPSVIILDEIGYYYALGLAVMYAQARSLGFMMVAAAQDLQALKRGEAGEESASLIANTKIKWSLALEDPEDTYELIKKAGGESYYSVLSGHEASDTGFYTAYNQQTNINYQKQDRIELNDLKSLNAGEGILVFQDSVVPTNSFYIDDKDKKSSKLPLRINRFIQIERPMAKHLKRYNLNDDLTSVNYKDILKILNTDNGLINDDINDELLDPLLNVLEKAKSQSSFFSIETGISMFVCLSQCINKNKSLINGHSIKKILYKTNDDSSIDYDSLPEPPDYEE